MRPHPQMNILDVVLSDEVVFHDTCKAMEEYYPFTQTFRADETLLRLAEEACQAVLEEPSISMWAGSPPATSL